MVTPARHRRRRHDAGRHWRDHKLLAAIGAAAACLLLASAALSLFGAPPRAALVGGPFRLLASSGRIVDNRSFRGRYMLLYFGYTHCPDLCPTTLNALGAALKDLGPKADRIQPLFVTVDPARDTATVLRSYLARFTSRLIGLTGTPQQIAAIEREYRVISIVHRNGAGGYDLDHSAVLYLMGPDGRFIVPIRAGAPAAKMAAALARYVS